MTDPLSTVWAKSAQRHRPRELLTAHLSDTLAAARRIRARVGRLAAAEEVLAGAFWEAVELACLTHDAGKVAAGFQIMVSGQSRGWGERHEVASLGFLPPLVEDPDLLRWVASVVVTHHRALEGDNGKSVGHLYGTAEVPELAARFAPASPDAPQALLSWLRQAAVGAGLPVVSATDGVELTPERLADHAHQLLDDLLDHWGERAERDEGLAAVLLQGAVTLADHLSSAHQELAATQPLDAGFRATVEAQFAEQDRELRRHQVAAADTVGHLLLRGPTGSGKTEAALLWAARQVADLSTAGHGTPRVFFTLPYLASINAMAQRLGALFDAPDAVGVSHSRAASYHLATSLAPEDGDDHGGGTSCRVDAAHKALSRAAATRLFHESVRVGTPYQLLRAALAGPAHSGILVDAANSVFVLDELHAYDARRLGYLLASARLWERLGGRVAVLSATMPTVLAHLFQQTLRGRVTRVDAGDLGLPPRHLLHTRDHHLTDPPAREEIEQRLADGASVLVIANNVGQAVELYDALAPAVQERHGREAALLLHSRFRRKDRTRIERAIGGRFGTGAPRRPGLLVATQVVEVSLDVDFDVLFTSAATLEALLQRFGRVNRVAARPPADVIVHRPAWTERRVSPGCEFADGVYPREPVETAWDILNRHVGQVVDEADATKWLDEVYATDWGHTWQEEVTKRQDEFERAFLRFTRPFDDRSRLSETFDELFDGTEAVLEEDLDGYQAALREAGRRQAAGRLLADELLVPLPHWTARLCRYEPNLRVRVVDGTYDPERGLLGVQGPAQAAYRPGEVL